MVSGGHVGQWGSRESVGVTWVSEGHTDYWYSCSIILYVLFQQLLNIRCDAA